MAARKKRVKSKAKPASGGVGALDAGWESFIGKALKKRPTAALWPDPEFARQKSTGQPRKRAGSKRK